MEANLGIFRGHRFIYLRCISEDGGRPVCESVVRDGAAGRDAAPMRGSQVITIMRMDVFIMGCVSRSTPPRRPTPPHPTPLPLSLSGSLEWLRLRPTSGGPGPHFDAPASQLQPVSRGKCVSVCVCECVRVCVRAYSSYLPPLPPPEAAPPLRLRPRLVLPG